MTTVRHLVLYGPPAAGKLTVAREISARYGLRLVDNHLTSNLAAALFDRGTAEFGALVAALRLEVFEAAYSSGLSIVTTTAFVEAGRAHIEDVKCLAAQYGVLVDFVHLLASIDVLERRVTEPARIEVGKLHEVADLRAYLSDIDPYGVIDESDMKIDNSELSPDETAELVARTIGLDR